MMSDEHVLADTWCVALEEDHQQRTSDDAHAFDGRSTYGEDYVDPTNEKNSAPKNIEQLSITSSLHLQSAAETNAYNRRSSSVFSFGQPSKTSGTKTSRRGCCKFFKKNSKKKTKSDYIVGEDMDGESNRGVLFATRKVHRLSDSSMVNGEQQCNMAVGMDRRRSVVALPQDQSNATYDKETIRQIHSYEVINSKDVEEQSNSSYVISKDIDQQSNASYIISKDIDQQSNTSYVISRENDQQSNASYIISKNTDRQSNLSYVISNENDQQSNASYIISKDIDQQSNLSYVISKENDQQSNASYIISKDIDQQSNLSYVISKENDQQSNASYIISKDIDQQSNLSYVISKETDRQSNGSYVISKDRQLNSCDTINDDEQLNTSFIVSKDVDQDSIQSCIRRFSTLNLPGSKDTIKDNQRKQGCCGCM